MSRTIDATTTTSAGVLLVLATCMIVGCGDGQERYAIEFRGHVNGQPLTCGTTYTNIGSTQSTLELQEMKMYVQDVALVDRDGRAVPLVLDQDDIHQRDAVALLDFEDGTGACNTGSPQTNLAIRGTAPSGDYVGLKFSLGVPESNNHLDAATAPAPLNEPGMWWSWKGGYKYIRLDAKTRGNPSYFLHLGATSCGGTVVTGFSCSAGNVPAIQLADFDPDRSVVVFDIGALWSNVDVDQHPDFQTDFVEGCMAFAGDPECPSVFAKLGMNISGTPSGVQTVFTVEVP